jgi:hypothetical protein
MALLALLAGLPGWAFAAEALLTPEAGSAALVAKEPVFRRGLFGGSKMLGG